MALREIRLEGDEILRKKSKTVEVIDDKIKELIRDMDETMHSANGVGISAVQVGILKRIIVIDVNYDGKALNEEGKSITVKGKGLLAEALCHEIDHLNGILFIDIMEQGTLEYIDNDQNDSSKK